MKPHIPLRDSDSPPSGQPRTAATWQAFLGDREPPLAVGRSPEDAWEQLRVEVLRHFREDADPREHDLAGQTEVELDRRKDDVLFSGTGEDEDTPFRAWFFVKCLTEEEALRGWKRSIGTQPKKLQLNLEFASTGRSDTWYAQNFSGQPYGPEAQEIGAQTFSPLGRGWARDDLEILAL